MQSGWAHQAPASGLLDKVSRELPALATFFDSKVKAQTRATAAAAINGLTIDNIPKIGPSDPKNSIV